MLQTRYAEGIPQSVVTRRYRFWAAEKDAGSGVLKSTQDFFENTVNSIGL